jgi:hypothetical protein
MEIKLPKDIDNNKHTSHREKLLSKPQIMTSSSAMTEHIAHRCLLEQKLNFLQKIVLIQKWMATTMASPAKMTQDFKSSAPYKAFKFAGRVKPTNGIIDALLTNHFKSESE